MPINMLARWPLVYVEWQDHDAVAAWVGEEEEETPIDVVSSVGWLFKQTDEILILVSNQGPAQGLVGNKQRILKRLITKTVILRRGKQAKPKKAPPAPVKTP